MLPVLLALLPGRWRNVNCRRQSFRVAASINRRHGHWSQRHRLWTRPIQFHARPIRRCWTEPGQGDGGRQDLHGQCHASAPYLKGFVDEIAAGGAPIQLSWRPQPSTSIAGTGHLVSARLLQRDRWRSAFRRNVVDRGFAVRAKTHPDQLRAALDRWGIINGGDWKNPDFGHFEWGGTGGVGNTRGRPEGRARKSISTTRQFASTAAWSPRTP